MKCPCGHIGVTEVQLHHFLNTTLQVSGWLASRSGLFHLGKGQMTI